MRGALVRVAGLMVSVIGGVGCGGSASPAGDGGVTPGALTYWGDIAPLLADKCVKCHQPGGIGPVRLDRYEDAKRHGPSIQLQTSMKIMPPYLVTHDGTCGSFEDGETLTDAQIGTIQKWLAEGSKEGTRVTIPAPSLPGITDGKEYKTPMLAPVRTGGKIAEYDEYRCFPVPSAIDKDQFITAYDVLPGNPAIVHHALLFLIDPDAKPEMGGGKTNAEIMQALDDSDPGRIGWPCFGLAGEGVQIESVPVVWAPGQGPVVYPSKLGVRQKKTDRVVIQIHYNLTDPKLVGMTDTTTVRLRYADTVERRAIFVLDDPFLQTIARPSGPEVIPPQTASFKFTWKKSGAELGLGALPYVDLMAVMPHMHERGRKKEMTLIEPDGKNSCVARVEYWDFNWQKFYFYKAPPRITPATQLQLTCDWSTLDDTMPVLPGWGTRNEMCIAILMLALPPGV